jgi:uncharacterized delta-60 repeat protein
MHLARWLHTVTNRRNVRSRRTLGFSARRRARPHLEVLEDRTLPSLTLTLNPTTIVESAGAGAATGTVTRVGMDNTINLTVLLQSSDPGEATVPASVVIPANQTSATFPINAVDDGFGDGNQTVTISAFAVDLTQTAGLDFGLRSVPLMRQYDPSSLPDVIVQPDGKIVAVAGSEVDGPVWAVTRLMPDGSLDTSFGTNGTVVESFTSSTEGWANEAVLQPDGKIIVVGASWQGVGNPYNDWAIARYNPNGTLDATFGVGGKLRLFDGATEFGGNAHDVELLPDGKLLVAGYASFPTGTDYTVVRLLNDGQIDTTFGVNGVAHVDPDMDPATNYNQTGWSMDLQADGKILVAGFVNGTGFGVVRFNADGTPDTAFSGDGALVLPRTLFGATVTSAGGNQVGVLSDGRIVVAGIIMLPGNNEDWGVAMLLPDGTLDNSFSGDGILPIASITRYPYDMTIQPDNKIILSGGQGTCTLMRLNPDGTFDTTFDGDGRLTGPNTPSAFESTWGTTLQADGKLVAVVGYYDDLYVVRYNMRTVGATAQIIVADTASTPVAGNDAYTMNEDATLSEPVAGVLGNDSDPNGDALTAVLVTPPASGTLNLNANGSFSYTPATDFTGQVTFQYRATDGTNNSNVATVTITVNPVNDAPVAVIQSPPAAVPEGTQVSLTGTQVDPDSTAWTYLWNVAASNGQVIAPSTASTIAFTPDENGTYTVTLTVTDNAGTPLSGQQVINIVVTNAKPAPNAGGPYTVLSGGTVQLFASATDAGTRDTVSYRWDLDNDGIFGETGAAAKRGNENVANPLFLGPNLNFLKVRNVFLQATDDEGESNVASTTVVIFPQIARFDFNAGNQVTEPGFASVRGADLFSPSRGFGWATTATEFDNNDSTALMRDGHRGTDNTFSITVVPGATYEVTLWFRDTVDRRPIDVYAEGALRINDHRVIGSRRRTDLVPGGLLISAVRRFDAVSADGTLDLRFVGDAAGAFFVINGIQLARK